MSKWNLTGNKTGSRKLYGIIIRDPISHMAK